jgi:hypothetical protein
MHKKITLFALNGRSGKPDTPGLDPDESLRSIEFKAAAPKPRPEFLRKLLR